MPVQVQYAAFDLVAPPEAGDPHGLSAAYPQLPPQFAYPRGRLRKAVCWPAMSINKQLTWCGLAAPATFIDDVSRVWTVAEGGNDVAYEFPNFTWGVPNSFWEALCDDHIAYINAILAVQSNQPVSSYGTPWLIPASTYQPISAGFRTKMDNFHALLDEFHTPCYWFSSQNLAQWQGLTSTAWTEAWNSPFRSQNSVTPLCAMFNYRDPNPPYAYMPIADFRTGLRHLRSLGFRKICLWAGHGEDVGAFHRSQHNASTLAYLDEANRLI